MLFGLVFLNATEKTVNVFLHRFLETRQYSAYTPIAENICVF